MSDTPTKKFSFARPGAATAAQPVENVPPAATDVTPAPGGETPAAPQNLPATQNYQPPAFYTGEGDDADVDAGDVRFPRLNLVQKSSDAELAVHGFGSVVLKGALKLIAAGGESFRAVIVGIQPKVWIEKTKYMPNGGGVKPRYARSLDEVIKFGGTDQWKFSKENDKAGSQKPWFMPSVTFLLLVERDTSNPDPTKHLPEDHFPFEADGKLYAAAKLAVKSTNYNALFTPVQSEKVTGVLRGGYNTHYIKLSTKIQPFSGGESAVFVVGFGEKTSEAVQGVCKQLLGT